MKIQQLPNGLRILFLPGFSESVCFVVAIKHGTRYESEQNLGISHLTEHLILSGSKKYPTEAIMNKIIDAGGGEINASTREDTIMFYVTIAREHGELALDLLLDALLNPLFAEKSFETEKQVILSEHASIATDAQWQVDDLVQALIFKNHALAKPIETDKQILDLKLWQIKRFHKILIRPNRIVVAVSGGVNQVEVFKKIYNTLGLLNPGMPNEFKLFQIKQKGLRIDLRKQVGARKVSFAFGFSTEGYIGKNRYALTFLNNILAARRSSRLYGKLRENGLIYHIASYIWHFDEVGYLKIIATTDTREKFWSAMEIIVRELKELTEKLISASEFELAKNHIIAKAKIFFSDIEKEAKFYAGQLMYGNELVDLREFICQIKSVTREQIRRLARMILRRTRLSFVAMGNVMNKFDEKELRRLFKQL